jgi:hypothetical protein
MEPGSVVPQLLRRTQDDLYGSIHPTSITDAIKRSSKL